MTIENRKLNNRLGHLERCAEKAPDGTYENANAAEAIGEAANAIRNVFRKHGFKASNNDNLRNVEVALYAYLLASNPDNNALITGEGFGEHVDGPAGERVLAQTIRDRDALSRMRE